MGYENVSANSLSSVSRRHKLGVIHACTRPMPGPSDALTMSHSHYCACFYLIFSPRVTPIMILCAFNHQRKLV